MNTKNPLKMCGRPLIGAAVALLPLTTASYSAALDSAVERTAMQADVPSSVTHIVEIRQFKFVPQTLTVKKGDVIIWRNLDVVPHTATAETKRWDSGNLRKDAEWTLVTSVAGKTDYICTYHPTMKGTIVVSD